MVIHDWEVVESKRTSEIDHEIDINNGGEDTVIIPIRLTGEKYWDNKICLACGKHINEIENKKNELIKIKNNITTRQKKANSMLKLIQLTL